MSWLSIILFVVAAVFVLLVAAAERSTDRVAAGVAALTAMAIAVLTEITHR